MDTAVLREIESLRRASMAHLRKKYQEVFQEETRCKHREHLFRRIAWRLQALTEGDLSERACGRANAATCFRIRFYCRGSYACRARVAARRSEIVLDSTGRPGGCVQMLTSPVRAPRAASRVRWITSSPHQRPGVARLRD